MTHGKGMVSAIPENLIKYADACTQGAEQLQTWVSKVLAPALKDYEASSGKCYAIDASVAQQVAAAYYTDRDVRTVGLAFQQTQEGVVTVGNATTPVWAKDSDINVITEQLQLRWAHQASWNAGAALGKRFSDEDPTTIERKKFYVDELNGHLNDPYFCASFFSGLNSDQVETILSLGGIQALVNAYSCGALSKEGAKSVGDLLGNLIRQPTFPPVNLDVHYITEVQKLELLQALARNPVAARNFADSLSAAQLRAIFHDQGSQDLALRRNLLATLTVAMSQVPDGEGHPLMNKVTQGFFGEGTPKMSRSEWNSLSTSLKQFYAAGVARSVSSVGSPGDSPESLKAQMIRIGAQVGGDLKPFIDAAHNADPDNKLLRDMLQGALGNVETMWIPTPEGLAGVAVTAAIGATQSLLQDSDMDPAKWFLSRYIHIPKGQLGKQNVPSKLNAQLALAAYSMTISKLVASGNIYPAGSEPGHEHPFAFGNDPKANAELLRRMLQSPGKYQVGKDVPGKQSAPDLQSFGALFWQHEEEPVIGLLDEPGDDG